MQAARAAVISQVGKVEDGKGYRRIAQGAMREQDSGHQRQPRGYLPPEVAMALLSFSRYSR